MLTEVRRSENDFGRRGGCGFQRKTVVHVSVECQPNVELCAGSGVHRETTGEVVVGEGIATDEDRTAEFGRRYNHASDVHCQPTTSTTTMTTTKNNSNGMLISSENVKFTSLAI